MAFSTIKLNPENSIILDFQLENGKLTGHILCITFQFDHPNYLQGYRGSDDFDEQTELYRK